MHSLVSFATVAPSGRTVCSMVFQLPYSAGSSRHCAPERSNPTMHASTESGTCWHSAASPTIKHYRRAISAGIAKSSTPLVPEGYGSLYCCHGAIGYRSPNVNTSLAILEQTSPSNRCPFSQDASTESSSPAKLPAMQEPRGRPTQPLGKIVLPRPPTTTERDSAYRSYLTKTERQRRSEQIGQAAVPSTGRVPAGTRPSTVTNFVDYPAHPMDAIYTLGY